jgi:hypothetical protein
VGGVKTSDLLHGRIFPQGLEDALVLRRIRLLSSKFEWPSDLIEEGLGAQNGRISTSSRAGSESRTPPGTWGHTHHIVLGGFDGELIHDLANSQHAFDEVAPYYLTIALDLGRGPGDGIDDPHLLKYGAGGVSGALTRAAKDKGDTL